MFNQFLHMSLPTQTPQRGRQLANVYPFGDRSLKTHHEQSDDVYKDKTEEETLPCKLSPRSTRAKGLTFVNNFALPAPRLVARLLRQPSYRIPTSGMAFMHNNNRKADQSGTTCSTTNVNNSAGTTST